MVAIFTGRGVGLEGGSAKTIGSAGLLGSAAQGRSGEQLYVNAANGNLLIAQHDEFLVGRGPDLAIDRTYNALGDRSDDNGDNWRQSTERYVELVNGPAINAASQVRRVAADGSSAVYLWDAQRAAYVARDPAGALDTLAYRDSAWVWTDGDTQLTERYAAPGNGRWRIVEQSDTDGNRLTFTYSGTQLSRVTTADGGWIQYGWQGANLAELVTGFENEDQGPVTLTRVRYRYDGANRLSSVIVDLTPEDGSIDDGQTYVSTYSYQGATRLIASLSQTDGSRADFAYDSNGRVTRITQSVAAGDSRTTSLAYGRDYVTTVTDPLGQVTRLEYGSTGDLQRIVAPPARPGEASAVTSFYYTGASLWGSQLGGMVDALGRTTFSYTYDERGNRLTTTLPGSVTTVRTYGARNELLTEREPRSSTSQVSDMRVTRYAYDAELHLRYRVDAEGGVTEYRYDALGQLTDTIEYPADRFDIGGLGQDSAPSEAQLDTWRDALADRSSVRIVSNRYDAMGNMAATIRYAAASATGVPLASDGDIRTTYAYDVHGRLLARAATGERGEAFAYDGLGRMVMSAAGDGDTLSTLFLDAQRQTVITHASGSSQILTYDAAGGLLSLTDIGEPGAPARTSSYRYDRLERLRIATDPNGNSSYRLFDAQGRTVAEVSALGEMTEYRYDILGRPIAMVRYGKPVSAEALTALGNPLIATDPAQIRPAASVDDLWSWQIQGDRGVVQAIDGNGYVTDFSYDAAGQLILTRTYSTALSQAMLGSFKTTPPTERIGFAANADYSAVRSYYDRAGQVAGTLDGEGHLTVFRYDAAGRKTEQVDYAAVVPVGARDGAGLDAIRAGVAASAADRHTRYAYDDLGLLRYVIDAADEVTGYRYDAAGRRTATISYGAIAAMPSGFAEIEAALQRLGAANWTGIRKQWSIYDASGRLAFSINPEDAVTGYEYDEFGRVVRTVAYAIRFTTSGLPDPGAIGDWAETEEGHPENRVTRAYYDARGELIYSVDGEGYVTGNSYDAAGRLSQVKRWAAPVAVQDGMSADDLRAQLGAAWTDLRYAYDAQGRLSDSWDGEGVRRHIDYNPDGTVWTDTVAAGTADQARTRFDYDGAGRLIARFDADGTAEQGVTRYAYDAMGNVVSITDPNGNVTRRSYDKSNRLLSEVDALGGTTRYDYDSFGDAVRITDPLGGVTQKTYDLLGRVVLIRDAEDYVTENRYSAFGDLTQVIRRYAQGGAPSAQDAITVMSYDRLGRLATVTDAEGGLQSFGRNSFGEEISRFNGIGWVDFTGYDRRGLVAWRTKMAPSQDSNGSQVAASVVTRFTYDARGNRIRMVEAEYLPEQRTTDYVYDKANRLVESRTDRVYVVSQSDHMTTTLQAPTRRFRYDARGNLVETIEPNGGRLQSYYDRRNRKIAEIDAVGAYSAWAYDANGNVLTSLAYEDQFLIPVDLPGSPAGPPAPGDADHIPPAAPGGPARAIVYSYDRLNRVTATRIASARSGSWNGSGYTTGVGDLTTARFYDAAGNLIRTVDANGKSTWSYFDRLGRKVAEVDRDLYLTSWTLDAGGNSLVERRYAARLVAAPGASAPAGVAGADDRETAFTYDRAGRRLSETRRNVVAWTVGANCALSAASTDSTVRYAYNALGEVVRKNEATGDTVDYSYDMTGRLVQETRAGFTGASGLLLEGVAVEPTVRYFYNAFGDLTLTRQGSSRLLVSTADRFTRYGYGPAGRLQSMTDASGGTTFYNYDLAGNVVTQTYVRQKADGTQVSEGILYTRDLRGRVIVQTTAAWSGSSWIGGDTQDTVYDAFGQVIATGVNGQAQVRFDYDGAGRMWRSNQGDGVWRFFVYDGEGNQTLTVESEGADLAGKSLDQVLAIATKNGTSAVGATMIDGINVTINAYSGRGQLIYTLMPRRELDMSGTLGDQQSTRSYNAFGERTAENVNGREVLYSYNTMGRSISIQQSLVQIKLENGALASVRPTETYYYDPSGRLVGIKDANGRTNTRRLLAGSGYGGKDPLVVAEYHPDGGVMRYVYDAFGDLRATTDEIGNVTTMTYDGMGRLTMSARDYETDYYLYDALGRRLKHWTGALGAAVFDATDYDTQGRVVRTVAMGGDVTTTSYAWRSALATPGMPTVGGWTSLTTYANGRTSTEQTDLFGRAVYRKDLGGHEYSFSYDLAGRMVESVAVGSDDFVYTYLNTGWVGQVATGPSKGALLNDRVTTYGYDLAGNLVREQYVENSRLLLLVIGNPPRVRRDYRNVTSTYDALGRLTRMVEAGSPEIAAATIDYSYDAVGNVREVRSQYHQLDPQGAPLSPTTVTDSWYRYDSMNRIVTSQGMLSGGQIVRGTTGIDMLYDLAGQRVQSVRRVDNADQTERYGYDKLGNLVDVQTSGANAGARSVYKYDGLGRLIRQTDYKGAGPDIAYDRSVNYNNKSQITLESVSGVQGGDPYVTTNLYDYGTGSGYALGAVVAITTTSTRANKAQPDSRTENDFIWYGGAVQSATRYWADTSKAATTSTYANNGWGQLTAVHIADGRTRDVSFVNDMAGQVIRRDESDNSNAGDPHEIWYRFGGEQHGYLGNNGTFETSYQQSVTNRMATTGNGAFRLGSTASVPYADFDQNYAPITSYQQGSAGGSYTVQSGDTLQSIAAQLWGDGALWYMLAEANGMSASVALIEGQQLIIPGGVQRSSNTATTFNPYDPLEVLGDTSPTTPQPQAAPKKKKCGGIVGTIIMVVIAVVVTIVTHGATAELIPTVLGSSTAGAVAAGAIAGAAGSIASQGFGLATGLQDRFSWKGVALAAIGGGVSGGFDSLVGAPPSQASFLSNVVRGAQQSALTQGIGVVTGLQPKFDWAGVVAAGIGAGVAGVASRSLGGAAVYSGDKLVSPASFGNRLGSSMADAIAGSAARSLVEGTSFGDNVLAALPQAIGNTIGDSIGKSLSDKLFARDQLVAAEEAPATPERLSRDREIEAILQGMNAHIDGPTYQLAYSDLVASDAGAQLIDTERDGAVGRQSGLTVGGVADTTAELLIPGYYFSKQGNAALERGDYLEALAYYAGATAEVGLTVATFGGSTVVEAGIRGSVRGGIFASERLAAAESEALARGAAAQKAGSANEAFSHGYSYADRVQARAIEDPVSHNFPYSFDDVIVKTNPVAKANGYNIYRAPGTMGNKSGVFEIGVTKDGVIDHRFFRPNK